MSVLFSPSLRLLQGFSWHDSHCSDVHLLYSFFAHQFHFISVFIQVVANGDSIIPILAINEGNTLKYRILKQIIFFIFLNWVRLYSLHKSKRVLQTIDLLCIKVL